MSEALFTREGAPFTGTPHLTEKGAPFFVRNRKCGRCGGAGGSDKWAHTGWTCFDCGGAGHRGTEVVKLFSVEKLAKLNAAAEKRNAKKAEAHAAAVAAAEAEAAVRREAFEAEHGALLASAEPFLERSAFLADVVAKARHNATISEAAAAAVANTVAKFAEADAAKAKSAWVGTIGERIEAAVTVERVHSFERPRFNAPWATEVVWIVVMRTAEGNALVSKGRFFAEKGEALTIRGTVKEHSEFRDEKNTVLNRVTAK